MDEEDVATMKSKVSKTALADITITSYRGRSRIGKGRRGCAVLFKWSREA
jgi:hypothetical protein